MGRRIAWSFFSINTNANDKTFTWSSTRSWHQAKVVSTLGVDLISFRISHLSFLLFFFFFSFVGLLLWLGICYSSRVLNFFALPSCPNSNSFPLTPFSLKYVCYFLRWVEAWHLVHRGWMPSLDPRALVFEKELSTLWTFNLLWDVGLFIL